MPLFRINAYLGLGRDVKAFLNLEAGVTRGPLPGAERPKKGRAGEQKNRKRDRPGRQKNRNKGGAAGSKNDGPK